MKRSELKRGKPLQNKSELRSSKRPDRKAPKQTKPIKQDWRDAECKRSHCRRCGNPVAQLHHTVGKAHQDVRITSVRRWVNPHSVIPLCALCHMQVHNKRSGLVGLLRLSEYRNAYHACKRAGKSFRRTLTGSREAA